MLSQKIKEKLETEGVCNCVIISIRDDILEMERGYNYNYTLIKTLNKENEQLKKTIVTRNQTIDGLLELDHKSGE